MLRLHLRSRAQRDAIGAGEYACAFSQRHDHDRAASLAHHAADRCARAIDAQPDANGTSHRHADSHASRASASGHGP